MTNHIQPKVTAAGAGGAFSVLVVFVLAQVGVELPPEIASALTTVFAFAAGYLKTN